MLADTLPASSFLEYAFLRWVLGVAAHPAVAIHTRPQHEVEVDGRAYRVDYVVEGARLRLAVELDGYAYHSARPAFTYDRLRQNDLAVAGYTILRFSYDAIRLDTERCVVQLGRAMLSDPTLAAYVVAHPVIERPEMDPDPLMGLTPLPALARTTGYFDQIRGRLDLTPLRTCQREAIEALANYYGPGQTRAACVLAVGAGKTALGVAAALAFTRRRALIVTPGSVIRGTFARALDAEGVRNALYGLPGGPLLPGLPPPRALVLDRDSGPIRAQTRGDLLAADILVTNFHALGTGADDTDLLAKLEPDDVDLVIVDEAHIAAADSYQRLFARFPAARTLLVSACFQRLDGRPIDADVVYRYLLTDAIADGHAKKLRAHRFAPEAGETTYEVIHPDGTREEIVGREALLALLSDDRRLATVTARSEASIHHVMRAVRGALVGQASRLHPLKPRVLFSALGLEHERQIARIANAHGIPCAFVHHSMPDGELASVMARFERDSGDLHGLVQLRMLGQGYDFPPISVVVPMRPYGSFNEFYQFLGRGVRVIRDPRLPVDVEQVLDIVYHAELGLDEHLGTLALENGLDNLSADAEELILPGIGADEEAPGVGASTATLQAEVVREQGVVEQRVIHDADRVTKRKEERAHEALAQRYAAYAQQTPNPVSFEQFVQIVGRLGA
jgi:superfamily II DNA or RNA helicase/very-short-patch-repair endonuclease